MMFEWLVLLLGIPVGYFISWLAEDELIVGKKYFRVLILIGLMGAIGFWIYGLRIEALGMGFIGVVALVSFLKS
jgi:hypothetical protein